MSFIYREKLNDSQGGDISRFLEPGSMHKITGKGMERAGSGLKHLTPICHINLTHNQNFSYQTSLIHSGFSYSRHHEGH